MDPKLTLDTAMKQVRQSEAVHEHQLNGHSRSEPIVLEEINRGKANRGGATGGKGDHNGYTPKPPRRPPPPHNKDKGGKKCKRCGKSCHQPGTQCPTKETMCYRCNRKGHYSSQCMSKTIAAVTEETNLDGLFLGAVETTTEKSWSTTVTLGGQTVQFKLDTGAEVSAISERDYKRLPLPRPKLDPPTQMLHGPTRQSLKVLGQFSSTLSHKGEASKQTIFVVQGLQRNLLSLPAIKSLQLVSQVDAIASNNYEVPKRFTPLFHGLGDLEDLYDIKLKEDAQPLAIFTPRNMPIPLRAKVKEELDRMESAGVISRVSQPTQWCSGMVVVPKQSGAVRICVDLKPLNENVLREAYPIPAISHTLAQLTGAKRFSKEDAKQWFLANSSHLQEPSAYNILDSVWSLLFQ